MDYKELIKKLEYQAKTIRNNNCTTMSAEESEAAANAIETLLAERDAAVNDLHNVADCTSCKFYEIGHSECDNCGPFLENWQWRGPQKHD